MPKQKKRVRPHIFYDYDGTLGDSLPGHIRFLHDMSEKYEVGLTLPDPDDTPACKKLIGMPMEVFIRNAGFSGRLIQRVLMMYEKTFGSNPEYSPKLFPGIKEMIETLFDLDFQQSIISSNFRENFEPSLEEADIDCMFLYKIDRRGLIKHKGDKGKCMQDYSERLQLSFPKFVYVGDAEEDYQSARRAEVRFVGSGYGWKITPDDKRFPCAASPSHLLKILKGL